MKIEQSWFYDISQFENSDITLAPWIRVCLFDGWNSVKKINISQGVTFDYYGFFTSGFVWEKHFHLLASEAEGTIKVLTHTSQEKLNLKLLGQLSDSSTKVDIDIIALVQNGGDVDIDGCVQIDENIEKVEWYLHQTNIFLWEIGKVRWIPTLLVRSNDVKAAHGCNIERISDDKLFYMRSRGIPKEDSLKLMIGSYFERVFSELRVKKPDFTEELFEKFEALI
jgi:hypothetical protein